MSELSLAVDGLRGAAQALLGVADALTELFSGTTESETDPPAVKPVTLEQVRAVLAEKSRDGHTAEVRVLLEKHGAVKLSGIDPGEYAGLLADAEALGNG